LKSNDEVLSLLSDKDNLFIVACNKCFKEFETLTEPELEEFASVAAGQGKTICGKAAKYLEAFDLTGIE